MAGETLARRFGRTRHAIFLLANCGLLPLKTGEVPGMAAGSEEEAGFIAQRLTFYKDTVKTIFRTDTTSPIYPVRGHAFSVVSSHGTLNILPNIINNIGLATFPHNTNVYVYDPNGNIIRQYFMAGNPNIA